MTLTAGLRGAAIAALATLLAVTCIPLLYRSTLAFPINYNEGWNAYITSRVLQGLPLYPARDTSIVNNYPPLAFFVAAAAAALVGDVLVAGRALAWVGFAGCTALIFLLLRRMRASRPACWYAALFFAALFGSHADLYVGMFDPQLFAQMLALAGLLLLLHATRPAHAAAAALLMVASGFMKHSLIALPAATALWLAWHHRRTLLLPWAATGLAASAGGLLACVAAFGPDFVPSLLVPRPIDFGDAARKLLRWLLPIELVCALATIPALRGGPHAHLVGLMLATGAGAALLGAAPAYTNYNMTFELLVAVSLGIGLLVASPPPLGPWAALAGAACLWLAAAQAATAQSTNWTTWSAIQRTRDATARDAVAAIRAQPGPALCGDLLLCFQAGKPMAFDPLNVGAAPNETQARLQADIAARRFGIIQLSADNNYLLPATLQAVRDAYRPLPSRPDLLVPASP